MAASISAKDALPLLFNGKAKPGLLVNGALKIPEKKKVQLPENLTCDLLDLSNTKINSLPAGLQCYELNLSNTSIETLPADLKVEAILNCSNCTELNSLPENLTVGTLNLRGCQSLTSLPENLNVWFLDLTACWAFQHWPRKATIQTGRLNLRGCTALTSLPDYLGRLAVVNLRDCPNLRSLPDGISISGWIDLAQCGVAESRKLPKSLAGVDIRWQGVRIDERILCKPETITVAEILTEPNAERRRVLLDRYGLSRFASDSQAEVRDRDTDPGGERRLLCIPLKDDEPIVALSCFCPSTQRQYFLRVPPGTTTCHQAAAWIAGFDDPADYHPVFET